MEEPEKNKMEWVEIIEPKTKEQMYANLTTGECVWDPPPGVLVKRTSDSQWWELFDHKTSRFYYYNAASQRTVWHRPSNCDIIPLAKLQTLKQNTQVKSPGHESTASSSTNGTAAPDSSTGTVDSRSSVKKESVATQTPPRSKPQSDWNGSGRRSSDKRTDETGKTGTTAPATSPVASPRPHRRHHHHHHHHHHQQHGKSGDKKNRCASDEDDEAPEPLRSPAADQKKTRRHHHHHTGSRKDSGRSSDSSTLSLSVGKRSANDGKTIPPSGSLTSPLRGTPAGRRSFDPAPVVDFAFANSSSTPLANRKKTGSSELSRQRSLDSETGAPATATAAAGSSAVRTKPSELFYRDGSLSRSLSFMQQRRPQTVRGQGAVFDLWSPQREHHQLLAESAPGVDGLCTPMINRKQRSFDSAGKTRLQQQHQQTTLSGSSSKGARPLGASASFRASTDRRDVIRPLGSDSSPSPKREKERDSLKRNDSLLRSADSSPHSAGDSGLATTGSRASQDSARTKTSGSKTQSSSASSTTTAAAAAASAAVTAATTNGPLDVAPEASAGGADGAIYDPVPLYSNIDYNYYLDPKAQAHLLPLQQYILEQAKLSGYRFADSSPVTEDGPTGDGVGGGRPAVDSFRSDDEEERDSLQRRLRVPVKQHHRLENNDDSDDFADDEGMSNVDDSSSNEYLDESQYLEEDDHYTQFLLQPMPPQRMQSTKPTLQHFSGPGLTVPAITPSSYSVSAAASGAPSAAAAAAAVAAACNGAVASDVIVEPEYSEADPGSGITGTYRSLPDGPPSSGVHLNPGSSSSLRHRPKEPMHPAGAALYSPVMERPGAFNMEAFRQATESIGAAQKTMSLQRSPSTPSAPKGPLTPTDGDIEKYAQNNLNIHKKGIFRKNLSIRDMLSWSKDSIRKPMLPLDDKLLKKEACDLFKLVQIYMGDRKCKPGMTCNSVAHELCNHAWNKPALRDELYLHICRQTTENPRKDSLRRGWELMAVCLYFFPPSPKLEPYLDGYINRHRDPGLNFTEVAKWPIHVQVSHYATISCRRLGRIGASGRRQERKPTLEEIEQARLQIFRPSMFGNTLEEIMSVQRDRFPHRKLPWIQTTLSEEILRLHGAQTEGIFRVPADVDEVNNLKNHMDQWEVIPVSDAHVPASLLKLWYRELYESLIPDELYQECVQYCTDPERAVAIVHRLPEFHKLVLSYLIRFLQIFAQTEVATVTKMDASNLAMVMAPNCLRCNASDPKVIFDNARKEMAFVRTLIQHLDTSFMEGVV